MQRKVVQKIPVVGFCGEQKHVKETGVGESGRGGTCIENHINGIFCDL